MGKLLAQEANHPANLTERGVYKVQLVIPVVLSKRISSLTPRLSEVTVEPRTHSVGRRCKPVHGGSTPKVRCKCIHNGRADTALVRQVETAQGIRDGVFLLAIHYGIRVMSDSSSSRCKVQSRARISAEREKPSRIAATTTVLSQSSRTTWLCRCVRNACRVWSTARSSSRWIYSSVCAAVHAPRAARATGSIGITGNSPSELRRPFGRCKQPPQATFEASELTVSSQMVVDWGGPHALPTAAAGGYTQNYCNCRNDADDSLTTVVLRQPATEFRSLYRDTRR